MNPHSPVNSFVARAKDGRNSVSSISGQQSHYVVDLSSGTVTIPEAWRKCRWVECDVAGTVRLSYCGDGSTQQVETKDLLQGERWLAIDVAEVFDTFGTTPASCTTQVRNDAGDLVYGVKLKY